MIQNRSESLSILEIGFGTGLNALLTYTYNLYFGVNIHYTGIEKYPISPSISQTLNYDNYLKISNVDNIIAQLHNCDETDKLMISANFHLTKRQIDFLDIDQSKRHDLIYHDAFSPEINPSFWEPPFLATLYKVLNPGGRLVTYCAKGQFKRDLKSVGFTVTNAPGPPGKREITIAEKIKVIGQD